MEAMASSPTRLRHQDLPDEIIEDILARMPAKSVLRCRCLSRAWAATLSSDAFVDRHLDLANRRQVPRLCFLPRSGAVSTVYAWSPPELGNGGVFNPLMAVPHNTRNGMLHAVTRTCRGVLLLRATDARRYYLCNPSMGQIVELPDGRMAGDQSFPSTDYASFGLGYDAGSRSHKVVRLLYHDGRPAGCDIYDVGGGGARSSTGHWRPVAALPPERVRMNQMGVFSQGHVHWPTLGHGEEERIVSISLADERFGYVTPPPGVAVNGLALTELAGRLCLLSAPQCAESWGQKSIDIWLLTDHATGSWGTHWHIDLTKLPPPPPGMIGDDFIFKGVTPLALVDGGRRVLFVSSEYQVATYCLATGTLEELVPRIHLQGASHGARPHLLVPYEESLVPVGPPFEDILWSSPCSRALSVALRRLPARELGRMKLVCRSWRAMLESHRFVTLHNACARAAAAITSPVPVAFVAGFATTQVPHVREEFMEAHLLGSPVVALESASACAGDPGADDPPLSTTRLVCRKPCHGLVLLSNPSRKWHVLCNPVTRATRGFYFPDQGHGCAGLGYHPSREEHVVVCLSYTSRCLDTRAYAMECWVWPEKDLEPRKLDSAAKPPIPVAVDVPPVHVGGKLFWPREPRLGTARAEFAILAFDVCAETFDVVPAPPALSLLGDADSGDDRIVLAELAGNLCAVSLSASMETMTVWSRNVEGWRREHVLELNQWPEFSPRTTELTVLPMAVDPVDGRILLDTGKALGYYDTRNGALETVYSLKTHLDRRFYRNLGDDAFFIATVWEDSLLRPFNRKYKLW